MTFSTHDGVEFEMPSPPRAEHYTSTAEATVLLMTDIRTPVRNPGVIGLSEDRFVPLLAAMLSGAPLPPVNVDVPPDGGPIPYAMRDGFHRYHAAVVAGYRSIPAHVLPYFRIDA
jgi:hypothetical protein